MSGVLCDKKMSVKLKSKIYKEVVRPSMMYGTEYWGLKVKEERIMMTTETKMLRWTLWLPARRSKEKRGDKINDESDGHREENERERTEILKTCPEERSQPHREEESESECRRKV